MSEKATASDLNGRETAYRVKLDLFAGPLDLLLQLIERRKLDITSISLAEVTDQYLGYVAQMENVSLRLLADFLDVAARLLLIKSRSLLPAPPALAADEEEDPAEALAQQLKAYRRFKGVAALIGERHKAGLRSYVRLTTRPAVPSGRLVPDGVTLADLLAAVQEALTRLAGEEQFLPATVVVTPHPITIHDKIALIRRHLGRGHVRFRDLLKEANGRVEVIVTFMAVLELLKQQSVRVEQGELFGDILIVPVEDGETEDATVAAGGNEAAARPL